MKTETIQILQIPIDLLDSHPNNPRPWSEKYQMHVDEEHVAELMVSMANGYDESEPILVRPKNSRYEIIKGHTRAIAQRQLDRDTIPSVCREMTNMEAGILLRQMQGQQVDPWSKRRHAYFSIVLAPEGDRLTTAEYAKHHGDQKETVKQWIREYKVRVVLENHYSQAILDSTPPQIARDIAALPESDWVWFFSYYLDSQPNESARQRIIKTLKDFVVPEQHQSWLDPTAWKTAIASEIRDFGQTSLPETIKSCISVAESILPRLNSIRPIWRFSPSGEPRQIDLNPKELFMKRLALAPLATEQVRRAYSGLIDEFREADDHYAAWLKTQQNDNARRAYEERYERFRLTQEREFTPKGYFLPSIADLPIHEPLYDAAFIHAENIKEIEEELGYLSDKLQYGANIIVLTSIEGLQEVHQSLSAFPDLVPVDLLIWHKPNQAGDVDCGDRYIRDFQPIVVAYKEGAIPYFEVRGNQPKATLSVPSCSTTEQLRWAKGQLPEALCHTLINRYVPKLTGHIFEAQTMDGTLSFTAKKMGRRVSFTTPDEYYLTRVTERCESIPFDEEIYIAPPGL